MKVTKLILWITALVLIAALGFSVISIAVRRSGSGARQISTKVVKNAQKFTDGLPREGVFKYETRIKNDGKYRVTFNPKLTPSGTYVLGCEVYDSDGKLLGATVLYNGEDFTDDYKFSEGTCSIFFRYITSVQDLEDYVEEYDASYGASSIRKATEKVNFKKFKDNGTVSVNCKVTVGAVGGSKISLAEVGVFILLAMTLLADLIVLGFLYKQKKSEEPEVYDGKAPEVPEPPAPVKAAKPQYGYATVPMWVCGACGEKENTGNFCMNCGRQRSMLPAYQAPAYPVPAYQVPAYQMPAYQLPAYTVPVTYQMPVQQVQPMQPVQPAAYAQPVYQSVPVQTVPGFAPAPVQPVFAPAPVPTPVQPVFAPAPVPMQPAYAAAPSYNRAPKPKKPAPSPGDPEFVEGLKNRIPAVGARYAAFCVVFLLIQFAGALLLTLLVPDIVKQYKTSISFGLVVLAVDLIGFPFIWLLMRNIPKTKIEQHSLSFSQWFMFLMMSEALILVGSTVGNSIHTVLTQPFTGDSLNNASSLMQNSNVIVRTLVVGIGAPVFEELIFRKVLIDRTIKYGEYVSIVMSGMMFGLLHGNFSQFFYAALIGMLFAYIYIRTGRIRYTIFLHMAINLSSALVLQTLLQKMLGAKDGDSRSPVVIVCALIAIAWAGGVLALGIIGIVRFIKSLKRKKLALNMLKGEPSHKVVRSLLLKDKALWLYIAMTILLFLDSYLPNIILFFMNKAG